MTDKAEANRISSRKYYHKHKEALNAARREKYKNDEDYRKKCCEYSRSRYVKVERKEKQGASSYYQRNKEVIKKKNLERYHRNKKKPEAEEPAQEQL